ncbi:AraC family transcriptional regulator [Pseudooceanicola sp. HF7]|uniref:helix-turn-helix transcriptional regulator n=1 Tax=Pseudooceanicola sp. HF7 TaxID=2721560 RepID=UPI001430A836|nr:AraC family transcriptional regulator [Pseudooceanicola sp. HF7]
MTCRRIRSPLAEAPHVLRPGQFTLLLLQAGQARFETAHDSCFEAPRLIWLGDSHDARLMIGAGSRGLLLDMSPQGLARALPATAFGEELGAALHGDISFAPGAMMTRLADRLAEIDEELFTGGPASGMIAGHNLSVLLIQLWRGAKARRAHPEAASGGVMQRFEQLVGLHLRDHWTVGEYAEALGVSRDRLARAVRKAAARSPQAYLHEALHREAVELLTHSGLQVAQIGFRLGFSDPGYFNRFFTRMEGLPPARFRKRSVRRVRVSDSFAAWP